MSLRADRLTVRDGAATAEHGVLALCACPEPAIRYAFTRATRSPSGEIELDAPRLEVHGVPVLIFPWLWLRPADAPGLRAPRLELRGDDGALIGSSAHVPLTLTGDSPVLIEASAAAYTKGGVELGADVQGEGSRTSVVFDHRRDSRIVARSYGAQPLRQLDADLTWAADFLRGDNAIERTPDLATATRPFDLGELAISGATGARRSTSGFASMGWTAHGERARAPLWTGPSWMLGGVSTVGGDASVVSDVLGGFQPLLATGDVADASRLGWFARGQSSMAVPVGPVTGHAAAVGMIRGVPSEQAETNSAARAFIGARLPLFKRLDDRWAHFVSPFTDIGVGLADQGTNETSITPAHREPNLIARGGLRNRLSAFGGASVGLELMGASVVEEPHSDVVGAIVMDVESQWASLAVEGMASTPADGSDDQADGAAAIMRCRLGRPSEGMIGAGVAARAGRSVENVRLARDPEMVLGEERSYLDRRGATGGLEAAVPIGPVRARGSVHLALSDPQLIAWLAGLRYLDPCNCFEAGLGVQRRIGRRGFDAQIHVDLTP